MKSDQDKLVEKRTRSHANTAVIELDMDRPKSRQRDAARSPIPSLSPKSESGAPERRLFRRKIPNAWQIGTGFLTGANAGIKRRAAFSCVRSDEMLDTAPHCAL